MNSIIQLLPDAIANQIAAGEVVQRPASVVKELLENAVDAGATRVDVVIKDAGKTLIQISDNGCGMSAQDARMCFERHATSKIRTQKDLFNIRTLGFRGEALSSIAAVAQVKLRSRQHEEELGTEVEVEGSEFKKQEATAMPPGTSFYVKNLFYNVPARRNFLKSNPVETRHILNEFIRVAIPNTQVHFTLQHNSTEVYDLPAGELKDRLVALFGEELKDKLSWIEESSGYVQIQGFAGHPEVFRKNRGEQFFFVNNRFIKSHYLNHAVTQAYQEVIPKETFPFYCIFLNIDPVHVDINIHPTKTEVKFDDERTIYVLLHSLVKRGLGGVHQAPDFDFTDANLKEAIYSSSPRSGDSGLTIGDLRHTRQDKPRTSDWDALYRPQDNRQEQAEQAPHKQQASLFGEAPSKKPASQVPELIVFGQFEQSYVLASRGSTLLVVDQHLAHQRILYERFLSARQGPKIPSQQLLFPQTFACSASDYSALEEAGDILHKLGFEMKEFGPNTQIVYGTPSGLATDKVKDILTQLISDIQQSGLSRVYEKMFESIARAVAVRSAVTSPRNLSMLEMNNMVRDLFKCEAPAYSPSGKPSYRALSLDELSQFFR